MKNPGDIDDCVDEGVIGVKGPGDIEPVCDDVIKELLPREELWLVLLLLLLFRLLMLLLLLLLLPAENPSISANVKCSASLAEINPQLLIISCCSNNELIECLCNISEPDKFLDDSVLEQSVKFICCNEGIFGAGIFLALRCMSVSGCVVLLGCRSRRRLL